MQVYKVGGAVRDHLMGIVPKDVDWVVIGETEDSMLSAGFSRVGSAFPVFLHPETKDEYALARKERSTGAGYNDFEVKVSGVTLEEDLSRRDLTINAIAMSEAGEIIDPFNGRDDLDNRVLRHVSDAFQEDPVRVLRIGRFLARYGPGWSVAPETRRLVTTMVDAGALTSLTGERVWKEISRGLEEPYPFLMIRWLQLCGLFELPSFADYSGIKNGFMSCLTDSCGKEVGFNVKFALVFAREWVKDEAKRSCIPLETRQVAEGVYHMRQKNYGDYAEWPVSDKFALLKSLTKKDVVRQQVFEALAIEDSVTGYVIERDYSVIANVDTKAITSSMPPGPAVKTAIEDAQLTALKSLY